MPETQQIVTPETYAAARTAEARQAQVELAASLAASEVRAKTSTWGEKPVDFGQIGAWWDRIKAVATHEVTKEDVIDVGMRAALPVMEVIVGACDVARSIPDQVRSFGNKASDFFSGRTF